MSFSKITTSQQSHNGGAMFSLNKLNYNYGTPPVAVSGLILSLNVWQNRYKVPGSGV